MKTENSPLKLELTNGIYFALITIVLNLIVWATALLEKSGLFISVAFSLFQLSILVVFLLICTKRYRDTILEGKITFGKAFIFALIIVIFSSVITGFYSYVFNKFIDPDYAGRIITALQEKTYQFMSNRGMSDDQIEAAMVQIDAKPIPTPMETMTSALMSGLIGGSIIALITSLVIRKNTVKDEYEEAMSDIKSEE